MIDVHREQGEIEREIRVFQADNPMMYIQQKIELPGRDLGMVFLDGEYLGTYARVSKGDAWNTTIHSGGKYASHTPPDDVIALAQRAQAPFQPGKALRMTVPRPSRRQAPSLSRVCTAFSERI